MPARTLHEGLHHDAQEPLVQQAGGERKDVDLRSAAIQRGRQVARHPEAGWGSVVLPHNTTTMLQY